MLLLQAEAASAEEQSEEIAEKWLESSLPVDEFLEEFLSVRTKAHLRRVKADKMAELLRNPHAHYPTSDFTRMSIM